MALNYSNEPQMRLARTIAWERGQKIVTWPETSGGLSVLIDKLRELPALPATDEQIATYQTLVGECVAKVENFQVERFATLPEGRDGANKATFVMKRLLRAADANSVRSTGIESFLAPMGEEESPGVEKKDGEVVPF